MVNTFLLILTNAKGLRGCYPSCLDAGTPVGQKPKLRKGRQEKKKTIRTLGQLFPSQIRWLLELFTTEQTISLFAHIQKKSCIYPTIIYYEVW